MFCMVAGCCNKQYRNHGAAVAAMCPITLKSDDPKRVPSNFESKGWIGGKQCSNTLNVYTCGMCAREHVPFKKQMKLIHSSFKKISLQWQKAALVFGTHRGICSQRFCPLDSIPLQI